MGTSKGYGGPPNGLVPTWLDAGGGGPADGGDGDHDGSGDGASPTPPDGGPAPAGGFAAARNAFTRFSKNGSSSALGTALSAYVGGGSGGGGGSRGGGGAGGPRRAAQRMGASRASGARLLGVVRDFQSVGPAETLRQLDLESMANQPASEVFLAMLEFLCPPGGAIDEAISRQAMLEAIGNLDRDAPTAFAQLAPEQLREFFLDFIALSIEGRVIADIGARGITLPADIATVEQAHEQLHDFIEGCCRVHLSGLLTGLEALNSHDVEQRSNEIYEAAFSLIADAGEDAT
ncbi:Qat anti-phage system associated protein QatB [Pseudorhodoferax sp. Leaf265]|uniref:Qat anti-phage system associated protein QatB n=1 Tax=Pseudorhodoferax sp. Leaf265 TaxID=1736315 RepID=UPI000ACE052E|nr:Qat anti-phage system associated protein QatB [Pseudorhodoferax sp. Leaf265]